MIRRPTRPRASSAALRQEFDVPGTPIRMMLRKGKNPYDAR